jgi:hypothetical protein
MANIETSRRDVPLFEVVEHIAGDLGQVAPQYEELDQMESGWPGGGRTTMSGSGEPPLAIGKPLSPLTAVLSKHGIAHWQTS